MKPGCAEALLKAIETATLGEGLIAGSEYLRNMNEARLCGDATARWVEVCYCPTPLQEERPCWEQCFELTRERTFGQVEFQRVSSAPGPGIWAG